MMGEMIGGKDGSVEGRVGVRCVGGMNLDTYGDYVNGVVAVTAAHKGGWEVAEG